MSRELLEWQKSVVNDDAKEVEVLKGRRVGATSLLLDIARKDDLVMYCSLRETMAHEAKGSVIRNAENNSRIKNNKENYLLIKDSDKYLEIKFTTINNINNALKSQETPDIIVFDEVPIERAKETVQNMRKINQIYYFYSPGLDRERSLYVVPSIGNFVDEGDEESRKEIIKEIKNNYNEKGFREEFLAGVTISNPISAKESRLMIPPNRKKDDIGVGDRVEIKTRFTTEITIKDALVSIQPNGDEVKKFFGVSDAGRSYLIEEDDIENIIDNA